MLRLNFRNFCDSKKIGFSLIISWIIILTFLYSTLSILRHNHFQSGGFDLGIYDQAVWQYSQFQSPYNTIKERFILADHLTLTLPLISPLFFIWDDVRILLIFQAFWLSFSSLAVYKLILNRGYKYLIAFILSFIYSLFYGIQAAVFFDFHTIVIAAGLLPWLAYFLETKNLRFFVPTLVLILLTQENMGIAVISIAVVYLFKKQFRKIAILLIVIGLLYSLVAVNVISLISQSGYDYKPAFKIGTNLILDFFNTSEKMQTMLYSFSAFSFLPVLSPGALLGTFIDLSQYLVSGPEFARMWNPLTHHRVILASILILGAIEALDFLKKRKINVKVITILLLVFFLFQQYFFHFPLNKLSKSEYLKQESWMDDNEKLIGKIPQNASLATQQNFVAHLSHRKEIYVVWPRKFDKYKECGGKNCWWLEFTGKPKYLVVDRRPDQWLTQVLGENKDFQEAISNMEQFGKIEPLININKAYLYKIIY